MAGRSVALDQRWAAQAQAAKCARGLSHDYGAYAPVGEMWSRQTKNAAVFPTHGMIACSLLRWQKADGSAVDWTSGRNGDVLIAPVWALKH